MRSSLKSLVLVAAILCSLTSATGAAFAQSSVMNTELETRSDLLIGESYLFLTPEERSALRLKKEPKYLSKNPGYSKLLIGNSVHKQNIAVVVDEAGGGRPPHLYVDNNNNGDLTDDVAPEWVLGEHGVYSKAVTVKATFIVGERTRTTELPYRALFFSRSTQKEMQLAFRALFNRSGTLRLGSKEFKVLLHTFDSHGLYSDPERVALGIDRNLDGKVDGSRLSGEMFEGGKPFNIDGETYRVAEISTTGDRVVIDVSPLKVAPKNHVVVGEPAPDFAVRTLGGKHLRLTDFRGKVVMLDFMAAWCVPCVAALPDTKNLRSSFNDAQFALLSVSLDGGELTTRNDLEQFVGKHKINWPVVFDGQGWGNAVAQIYNVSQLPVHVVIDREGVVRLIGRSGGKTETERTRKVIAEYIGK